MEAIAAGAEPSRLRRVLRVFPDRMPVPEPRVDEEFENMPALRRSFEALRFQFLRFDHGISPGGRLRACAKALAAASAVLLLFGVLVMPVLLLVALAAAKLAGLILAVVVTLVKIVAALILLLAILWVLAACVGGR